MATNPNVYFQKGTQSRLNEIIEGKSFTDGSFYLTTDTDRLYFAQSSSELVLLNRSVQVVNALPTTGMQDGDIYYIPSQNILAIYDSDANSGPSHWTQINPDTNTKLTSTTSAISVSTTTNGVVVTSSVIDDAGDVASGNFAIVGSNGTSVTHNDNVVTVSSDTYSLGVVNDTTTSQGIIRLSSSTTTSKGDVILKAGSGVNLDKSGNTITLSGSGSVNSISHTATSSTSSVNITTTIGDSLGGTVTSVPVHYVITQASDSTVPFASYSTSTTNNGVILNTTINAYTKKQVDDKIAAELKVANALTYRGTIGSQEEANRLIGRFSNTAQGLYYGQVGDVYKISATRISSPIDAEQGDLVIAYTDVDITGSETGDDKVKWERVPSGDEQVISGTSGVDNGSYYTQIEDNSGTILGKIALKAGNHIAFSSTTTNNGQLALTIDHDVVGTGTAVSTSANITSSTTATKITNTDTKLNIVTDFNIDDKGHVSNVQIGKYEFDSAHLEDGGSAIGNNGLFVGNINNSNNGSSGAVRFALQSSTLNITSSTATMEGKTVPVYNTELVWGSF